VKNIFLLLALGISLIQHPADLVGTWKARMVVDEKELASQPQQFQKLMKEQVAKFQQKPWMLTLKKDGTYILPLKAGQNEEGIWASKELLLHVRVKKQTGKKAAVERLEKYAIAPDRKSFRTRLTPYLSVEYRRS
jgi:hypothetical protein